MKKEASLSIVEDIENHKFLMIKHQRGINKGCMNFPGGKKEPFETMEECVVRETLEETGLKIENPVQVGYIEFPTKDFYVYVFRAQNLPVPFMKKRMKSTSFGLTRMRFLMSRCGKPIKIFYRK